MTSGDNPTDASSTSFLWNNINWTTVEKQVHRLQMRIAKAVREKRDGKVKALQWILTHSQAAKLLAVKRVTSNQGRHTSGVDNVLWRGSKQKWVAANAMHRRGYRALPLRRIYIPKKDGSLRPLGIPTFQDRAMQALYLMALEPVSETTADIHSYGFRPKRSTADAIERCFSVLCQKSSAQWVLEADIVGCFDHINHNWLIDHVPMDTFMLKQWLNAGYREKQQWHSTQAGTPQGGIISPCLANMALDGLEAMLKSITKQSNKVHMVRYADDFVITSSSKELLEQQIKPAIETFLCERGLALSPKKTRITSIHTGFDFLGFNVRKYGTKLLIKPSKSSIKRLLAEIRTFIRHNVSLKTGNFIHHLNRKMRGWAYYYRHVVAKKTFAAIDYGVFHSLWRWICRRHPGKSARWKYKRYFTCRGLRNWIFHASFKNNEGIATILPLFYASDLAIKRHVVIKAKANPYDPKFTEYFISRKRRNFSFS
jgi:RNA-directed DNA polymerase